MIFVFRQVPALIVHQVAAVPHHPAHPGSYFFNNFKNIHLIQIITFLAHHLHRHRAVEVIVAKDALHLVQKVQLEKRQLEVQKSATEKIDRNHAREQGRAQIEIEIAIEDHLEADVAAVAVP